MSRRPAGAIVVAGAVVLVGSAASAGPALVQQLKQRGPVLVLVLRHAVTDQSKQDETIVFRPLGIGRFRAIGRMAPAEWSRVRTPSAAHAFRVKEYPVPIGSSPHDVAPSREGSRVWYTAQAAGKLGLLDPATGRVTEVPLGDGSAPHGVIVGPDGAAWVTDGGLNAIVRVDPETLAVRPYPLPASSGYANLNTATFDRRGRLWFTGQSGIYGRLDPRTGAMRVFRAPGGAGPYGITTTPAGQIWYASLAGSHVARIDLDTGKATVFRPPTRNQGARRIWSDSRGRLWVSEWNAGKVARYDPVARRWREWRLPGAAQPYAVYVDDRDVVWLTDFGSSALVRFDPRTERFSRFRLRAGANVRQLLGRPGVVWGAESGADRLVSISG
jgi:virginiamycin B lyase